MARTYLEKFYFPLHVKFIEGNTYTKELSNEEVIENLPFIQNHMNSIQEKEKPQGIIAEYINDNIPCPKVITASWEVMHRYGVPYGLVRVKCSEPLTVYERDLMRFSVADVNGFGFWSKFQYEEIKCNDKLLHAKQCKVLLKEKKPLDKLFLAWEKHEGDHMNEIRDCIEYKANELIKLAKVRADRVSR